MSVPFFDAHSAAAMYPNQHAQMYYAAQQQQALAAQQAALYGGAYSPALSTAMYGQQAYQQGYQGSSYPQPGSMAYTKKTTSDGNIVYQPVIAQEVPVQTPQGVVKAIQYVPAGATTSAATPQAAAATAAAYGVQTSQLGYPSQAQAPNPSQMGYVPGVSYDMRTYADAFPGGGGLNTKDSKKERRRREKEIEREEKERRRAADRAAKKRSEWAVSGRDRQRAESDEFRRAREFDRQEEEEEEEEEEDYGVPMGRPRSRHPSMSAGVPDAGYDPSIEAKLASIGFGGGPRSRRPSNAASMGMGMGMGMGMPGGPPEPTYGGAPAPFAGPASNGAGMRPGMPQGPGGILHPGAPGGPGGPGGIIPGGAGGGMDGYTRDRRISQRSMRDSINPAAGIPGLGGVGFGGGLTPGGGPGAAGPYIKSPSGQVMPLGDGPSPQRTPISQIPPSPGHALGRRTPYAAPTYGGLPPGAPGAGVGPQPGPIVPAGVPGAPQANITQYSAAQAFSRPFNPACRCSPFKSFPIFNDMDEMFNMLPEVPPLPAAIVDHDVQFEDWARWMTDLTSAWQQIGHHSGGSSPSSTVRGIKMLIEAWNHNFFLRRSIYFRFAKARGRRQQHRRSRRGSRYDGSDSDHDSEDDSDDLSSEHDDDDDLYEEEDGGRYQRSRKQRSARRRREEVRYRLICEYIPPSNGGMPAGYPAYA